MERVAGEARIAIRAIRRRPGVTALAVLSLAIAIGFGTAGFSVVDAMFLRDAPVREPGTLARVYVTTAEQRPDQLTWVEYEALASQAHATQDLIAEDRQDPPVRLPDREDFPITAEVSDNYFDVLGVRAARGAVFHAGAGRDATLVITDHYWREALGGDPAIIGRWLPVGPGQLRVIGVLPPHFRGKDRGLAVDLFVPVQTAAGALRSVSLSDIYRTDFALLARLRPNVTINQAREEVDGILRQLERAGQEPARSRHASMVPFQDTQLAVKLLFLAILMLLIGIAAANLANLRLVENESRRQETGIRLALGAGPVQLARTHIAEALLLTGAGTAVGIVIASRLVGVVSELLTAGRNYLDYGIRLDIRTLAFTSLALITVTMVSSLIPLRETWKRRLMPLHGSRQMRSSRWLNGLVIAQMSVVTGVSCPAALLWRSLEKVSAIRPAMDPDRELLMIEGFWPNRAAALGRTEPLAQRLSGLPGIGGVAWARRALLSGSGGGAAARVEMPGQPVFASHYNQVSANYFAVTGARVLAGRTIQESDSADATRVVMVNAAFGRRFFPGANAVSSWVKIDGKDRQIVGIVEDGPTIHLREPLAPYMYFPFAQAPSEQVTFFAETSKDPGLMADAARTILRGGDRNFTIVEMRTMGEHMREARSDELLAANLAGSLAIVGLLLAAAGLFGVTQFAVARRTAEFGVRAALGANPFSLLAHVLGAAGKQLGLAIPIGWLLAFMGRHALEHLLYGVAANDTPTFLISGFAVAVIGITAAVYPAWRAARIDPMAALRHE